MDPIAIAERVEERYRRYLQTTFYFRDPEFRRSFREALRKEGLSTGPYIEGTPVYLRTTATAEVVTDVLGADPDAGFLAALQGSRQLYWHQEEAIRRANRGRNIVVATGTGSGKTETFLYPILLSLYREFLEGSLGPGVRALLLYPMNALANDQRQRLGEIARVLEEAGSPFRFTFGQYIGETPEDATDRDRHAADWERDRMPGELIYRNEMRATPPHILLTNYSMLEYLLTRPYDSALFDGGRAQNWRFIVLDEVHQYRGAEGTEMALLIRRLKRRLREGGRTGPFQCIATSATLADREDDQAAAARFAQDLFDEPFTPEDLLRPRTVEVDEAAVTMQGLDPRAHQLRRWVTGKALPIDEVAAGLFPELDGLEARKRLASLAEQLVRTKDPRSGSPLLSTRFHLFLRALEGVYVQFWPTRRAFIDPNAAEGPVFQVALCRECGQHYLVAPRDFAGGPITVPVRDPGQESFGVTFLREVSPDTLAEDTEASEATWELCVRCGVAGRPGSLTPEARCSHQDRIVVVAERSPDDEDRADQVVRCGACGYRSQDPVREVVYGADGPNAVIGTTLIRSLPEDRQKVLAFADGRQEAAFFAWYMERSYTDLVTRNLFHRTLERLEPLARDGLSLSDLVLELEPEVKRIGAFPASATDVAIRRDVWIRALRELLDTARTSLEGVGLARWEVELPPWYDLARLESACPVRVEPAVLRNLVIQILDTVRADRAVELPADRGPRVDWELLGVQGLQSVLDLAPTGRRSRSVPRDVRAWDGLTGRRGDFLRRWLTRRGVPEDVVADAAGRFLRGLWEWILESDGRAPQSEDRLFKEVAGSVRFRLNTRWFRLHRVKDEDTVYRCRTCARVFPRSVEGVCPRYRCPGTLEPIPLAELEPDHYRDLYRAPDLVGPMRVEEHTAQLTSRTARQYQKAFQNGEIQLLSSSTTFELGVDLGDLDAIFLRNVPPEASNYVQRVGRSGRRSGHPGLAVTYCRRTPHDLYHFRSPERLLSGETRPPLLHLANPKIISRHMTAYVLSGFFREDRERFRNVAALVGDFENPSLVEAVRSYVERMRPILEMSLKAIVPADAWEACGLQDGSWVDQIVGPESRLALAEATVVADWSSLGRLQTEAVANEDFWLAGWCRRRRRTIEDGNVLTFLSRQVVIPKYGFPVDVVSLEILGESDAESQVELQRDLQLAIAEFAPSARVVANKREWVSYGLKRAPSRDREWQKRHYRYCRRCNSFDRWGPGDPTPPRRCDHHPREGEYVVPEFGFVTRKGEANEPTGRQPRLFTTRPYFAGSVGEPPPQMVLPEWGQTPVVLVTPASPGRLVVLCEGRRGNGFYICPQCGAGFPTLPKGEHHDPYGRKCDGLMERVALGHEFETDVLGLRFVLPAPPDAAIDALSFSVAYALLAGAASAGGAPLADLNVAVAAGESPGVWPIILYDDVPGGAGLVGRLQNVEVLRDALQAAVERTDGSCGCKVDESCYGCLRSYRNQFIHHRLSRGLAHRYLEQVLVALDRGG